jgi:spermidine/putrescine transport system substrate-binding protein
MQDSHLRAATGAASDLHAQMSRAQLLKRGMLLAIGTPSAAAFLSACGAGNADQGQAGGNAAATAKEELSKTLTYTNWADWIAPGALAAFRSKYGVTVKESNFTNNEELLTKLRSGAGGYDLANPGGSAVQIMVKTGMLEKLNPEWIPNTRTLKPRFVKTEADPTGEYAIANDWSFHGIGFRSDKIDDDIRSWEDLWKLKKKYSGKITVLDDQRDVIGATLRMLGHSYNSTEPKELEEAGKMLGELKPHLLSITSTNQREALLSGQAYITMDWNQSVAGANQENDHAQFILPSDGTGWYGDYLVIPKGSKNVYTAHVFMNFLHAAENYEEFVKHTTTPWTNSNVDDRLPKWMQTSEWLNPPEDAPLEFQVDVGKATPLYSDVWTRFRSA